MANIVREKPPISIQQRLNIYQEGYVVRLLASLREDFPRVEALLGQDRFEELATSFVQNPKRSHWNIAEISEDFPTFLESHSMQASFLAKQSWAAILNDWLEDYELDPVSLESINQGAAFCLQRHPRNSIWQHAGKYYLSSFSQGEVIHREVTPLQYQILQVTTQPHSLDHLSQEIDVPENELAQALTGLLSENLLTTTKGNTDV